MVNMANNDLLVLNRLYKQNVIDFLNFLSYQKDKENFKEDSKKEQ